MDTDKIERDGIAALKTDFDAIAAIKDPASLAEVVARFQTYYIPCDYGIQCIRQPTFDLRIGPDPKDSSKTILQLAQGGLGLPERDYYLEGRREGQEIRDGVRAPRGEDPRALWARSRTRRRPRPRPSWRSRPASPRPR